MNRRTFLRSAGAVGVGALGSTGLAAANPLRETVHEVTVAVGDGGPHFDPIGLYVERGDTVRWTVESGRQSVTAYGVGDTPRRIPDGAATWDSGPLETGDTFERTITTPGTYDYFSRPDRHAGAVGRIVCWSAGGPATASPIPDAPASGTMPPSEAIMNRMAIAYPYTGGARDGLSVAWKPLGLFAGVGAVAVAAYHATRSDGDRTPVGSPAWKRERGIDEKRRPDRSR